MKISLTEIQMIFEVQFWLMYVYDLSLCMSIHKIGQFPRSNVQLWPKNLTNFDPHKVETQ